MNEPSDPESSESSEPYTEPCAYCDIDIGDGHPHFVFEICTGCHLKSHLICLGNECKKARLERRILLKCKNCCPDPDRDLDWDNIGRRAFRCMFRLQNLLEDPIPELRGRMNSQWGNDSDRERILNKVKYYLKKILQNTR